MHVRALRELSGPVQIYGIIYNQSYAEREETDLGLSHTSVLGSMVMSWKWLTF